MRYDFQKIFAPTVFPEDGDKSRSAAILNILGWSIVAVSVILMLVRAFLPPEPSSSQTSLIFVIIISIAIFALAISHRGFVRIASLIMITGGWLGLTTFAWVSEGIRDVAVTGYFISILMAGLLLGWKGAIGFITISTVSAWLFAYAEVSGWRVTQLGEPWGVARDLTGVFVISGIVLYLMITNLQHALDKSNRTAHDLSTANEELNELRADLEQRVEERTSQLNKRASQLEAVSSVARTIASVQDLDTLLPTITRLVSQHFGFYHVGIFLLDPQRENVVLRAANSPGGLQMLSRQHRLPLDMHSIVGYSTMRGEPRIALDVGTDATYFNNPDLPNTRSEMAIPLRVAGEVIGSLDVQSVETNAFSEEDVSVLTTLADQLAIAIENARLFEATNKALDESRVMFEQYTQQEWRSFARQSKTTGFLFDGKHIVPLDLNTKRGPSKAALQTGRLAEDRTSTSIAVPIKLRGQTIGVLDVRSKNGQRPWKADEIAMLEAAAERAALALENARLIESAQRRAARERAIGDISSRIGSVSNLESILQTAVEELGRRIGGAAEVTLEINTEDAQDRS